MKDNIRQLTQRLFMLVFHLGSYGICHPLQCDILRILTLTAVHEQGQGKTT